MGRIATGAVVAALALAAAACGGDDDTAGSADSPSSTTAGATSTTTAAATTTTTTAAAGAPVVEPGDAYVALGSSIASGFGISVQSTSCGRSDRSYPHLVAAELGLALTDVTCGAAVIPNVVDTPQGDNPPQLAAVTPDTELITVSVGGNDIVYNGTAVQCADPATECVAPPGLDDAVPATAEALVAMIATLRAAAPEATVVLVTYPREFPVPDANCPDLSVSDAELAILGDMGERLEAVFVDVAERTGVVLVDPYVEPGDHTGCAPPAERWVAGAVADDGFAFHPTALGHEEMARLIVDALDALAG